MCGTYYIDDEGLRHVAQIVDEVDQNISGQTWVRDLRPTDYAPVMKNTNGQIRLTVQKWGYPGFQNKGVIFNARAESVREKKLFSRGIEYHRTVIPAVHFYEWNPYREKNVFSRQNDDLLYFAGFYDVLGNEERFVILTTAANKSMQPVHDRMPLVLESDQIKDWLQKSESIDAFLKQKPTQLQRHAEYEQMKLF